MTFLKRYLPLLIIVTISLMAWALGVHHYFSFKMLKLHHEELETYINLYPFISFAIYMGVYITLVGLSIPGATFMTLAGGFLFGQLMGMGLVVISATIGATILFMSTKLASEGFLLRKAGPWIEKMKTGFQEDAFYYLLTLRLIPIFPFVAINLVAAVFQIPLRTFIIGTFIGIIPGSFVYVSIGNALKEAILTPNLTPTIVLEPKFMMALVGLGILSLLPVVYKRFHNR